MLEARQEQVHSSADPQGALQKELLEKLGQDNFDWVVEKLEQNGASLLPRFIVETVSELNIETAYALYRHPRLRKYLKSKENDSVLVVACRVDDNKMVDYCLTLESEKKSINANVDCIPSLFAAIDSLKVQRVQQLLAAGADINVEGENLRESKTMVRMSAGHRAIRTNDIDMVQCIFKTPGINSQRSLRSLRSVLNASCKMVSMVEGKNQRDKAVAIFKFILENSPKDVVTAALRAKDINGHTALTFALVNVRECAAELIRLGLGVFDLDAEQRSPLYWARAKHENGIKADLNTYYLDNVGIILDLFLHRDRRVCEVVKYTTNITLVLPMVSEWREIRKKIFKVLEKKIYNEDLNCAELRLILDQIIDPRSPLRQFFNLGYGKHFWSEESPWPSQFLPLQNHIKEILASNNSIQYYCPPPGYDSNK